MSKPKASGASHLRLRYFVGPTAVKQIAERIAPMSLTFGDGFEIVPSTEHLTVLVANAVHRDKLDVSIEFLDAMKEFCGTNFGLLPQDVR